MTRNTNTLYWRYCTGRKKNFLLESCLEPQHNIPQHVLSHWITSFVENHIKGFSNQHEYQFLRTFKVDALLVTDPYASKELEFQMNLSLFGCESKPDLLFLYPLYQRREYQAVFISQGGKLDPVFYSSTPPQKGDLWGDFPTTQSWRTRRCKCQSGSPLHSIKAGIGLCSPPVDCPSNEERLNHNSKRFTAVYVAVGGPCGVIIPSG